MIKPNGRKVITARVAKHRKKVMELYEQGYSYGQIAKMMRFKTKSHVQFYLGKRKVAK